ncbi:hypothetical protein TRIATDRAFT_259067 [Trichoderma atroviride IMI 206040]|uniref:Uncharacterized protein n=1 Tax=Hypocrea atroviridis (strain ATCC 20476 / IMI 206040) TaxID=452589 RepID=G9P900_HYPAI|nr:uncharacterized protein TRIATDRAFT_259067 [Trichoderma atroviride IMI 206040]EHK41028.1 hypothetical protein TRIATDRAFT_259067 [Trichoderma atroviride IMI 206040]
MSLAITQMTNTKAAERKNLTRQPQLPRYTRYHCITIRYVLPDNNKRAHLRL